MFAVAASRLCRHEIDVILEKIRRTLFTSLEPAAVLLRANLGINQPVETATTG
jgi:hypothetical protein